MWTPYFLFVSAIISSVAVEGISLFEALKNAGASDFAAQIESDPTLSAFFTSSQVQTVFAPVDGSVSSQRKGKRQNGGVSPYQAIRDRNTAAQMSQGNGQAMPTGENAPNINGGHQFVVSNPQPLLLLKRQVSSSNTTSSNTTSNSSPLNVFSGLGNNVSTIQTDIPYDGGLIHTVDGFFTLPETLSTTAIRNGQTTFARMGNSTNMTALLDNTPSITSFIPSNAAFSASNATAKYNSSASLLSGHIIPNFLGYLPALVNGSTFTTQGGTNITVTLRGSDTFINNAKIIASNQILQNGVAHVIDSIIVPSPSKPGITFTGSASSTKSGTTQVTGIVVSALLICVAGLLV